nr:hypothetical protein [Bacteroidota bacterium]
MNYLKHFGLIPFIFLMIGSFQHSNSNNIDITTLRNYQKGIFFDTIKSSTQSNSDLFNMFWEEFRYAILNDDTVFIMEHTIFPLSITGPMDGDSIVKINRDQFETIFDAFLQQISGLNFQNYSETELEYILRTPSVTVNHLNIFSKNCPNEKVMVGAMIFEYQINIWRLVLLSFQYPTFEKAGIFYPDAY